MIERLRRWRAAYRALTESFIWRLLGRQRRWIYGLLAAAMLNFLVIIGLLDTLRRAFDSAIVDQIAHLDPLVSRLTGLALLGLLTGIAQRQIIARIGFHLEYELRLQLYRRLQTINPRLLDDLPTGQLITRAMTDLTLVELLVQLIPTLGIAVTLLSALAVLLLVLDPVMGVVALLGIPINAYLISRVRRPLLGFSWLALNRRAEVTTAIDEAVRGVRVVKAFGREDAERGRVQEAAKKAFGVSLNRVRMMARYDLILQVIPLVLNGAILILAGRAVGNGGFSVGQLLIFLIFTRVFTDFAQSFDEIASGYMFAKSGALRIFELLNWGGLDADIRPTGRSLPPSRTGLELRGAAVSFGARVGIPPVELTVAPGQLAVLIGGPGSGKSLVAAVASGAVAPTAGHVLLDGAEVSTLNPAELRHAVRVIAEDPFLFARSVRHNLEMGAGLDGKRPSDERLQKALWAAAADEIVAELPEGLEAPLGDRGMTLSGGQRQRLALARGLVSPPRVLVLDDALSAVNPTLELEILRRIRELAPETGILLISRRPSARAIADSVVTLPDPVADVSDSLATVAIMGFAAGDAPPDAELLAAVELVPPDRDAPEVGDAAATSSDDPPTVRHILGPFRSKVGVALLALLGFTLVSLIPEGLFKIAVDDFKEGTHGDADRVALVLVVIAGAMGVLAYALKILTAKINEGVLYVLRRRTFQRLSRLGIDYYDRELPGQVAARVVHDLDRISAFVENGVYQLAVSVTVIVASLTILTAWNPDVGRAVLAFVPILLIITAVQIPLANRAYIRARARLGDVIERFQEDVAGRYVINAFGAQQQAENEVIRRARGLRSARRTSTMISNTYVELMQYIGWLAMAAVISKAGDLSLTGQISAGSVVALQLYLSRAMAPIPQLSDVLQRYLAARASFKTLAVPYRAPILPVEDGGAAPAGDLTGAVRLDGVSFRYPGTDRDVLHDVTLEIPAGSSLALVGPTGAGKSSIAKMIGRIYDPTAGAVVVDGRDLRTIDISSYRRRLGIVPQDAFCFRGTVASNVAYGKPDATRVEIEAAIAAVSATEILARVPGGLDGLVDEEGRNLTAAQRQLIALARAVLVAPDILVLDEATSSLDADVEERVLAAVTALGRTIIFVTHRLAVARHADSVAVVAGGLVVAQGTHTALRRAAAYKELWSAEDYRPAKKRAQAPRKAARPKAAAKR